MDDRPEDAAGAARQYIDVVSAAFAGRAAQLERLNAWYAPELAQLTPGKTWPDGSPMTAQSLHARYLGRRAYADQECNTAVSDARAQFEVAVPGTPLPRLPDESIPAEPVAYPAPAPSPEQWAQLGPEDAEEDGGEVRRRRVPALVWAVLTGVVLVGLIVFFSARSGSSSYTSSDSGGSGSSVSYSSTVDVLYEVEGTAKGTNVTLESPSGTSQLNGKAVPLGNRSAGTTGLHFTMPRGHFLYLSAQNDGDTGSITCKITVDGVLVASNTSSGAYAIATCNGTAR